MVNNTKIVLKIYDFFSKRKHILLLLTLCIIIICILSTAKINFSEDVSGFLPENQNNEQENYAYQHVGASNTIMVYFSNENESDMIPDAIDRFVNYLYDNDIELYSDKIQYSVDESEIIAKMK